MVVFASHQRDRGFNALGGDLGFIFLEVRMKLCLTHLVATGTRIADFKFAFLTSYPVFLFHREKGPLRPKGSLL